jgi:hypothetical protein
MNSRLDRQLRGLYVGATDVLASALTYPLSVVADEHCQRF